MAAPVNYEPNRIFVGGLPTSCDSSEKLGAFFVQFGPIREAKVHFDPGTGKGKGFGFVTFEHPESVDNAVLNDTFNIIDNKWVNVKRCVSGGGAKPSPDAKGAKWHGAPNSCEDAGLWLKGLPLDCSEAFVRSFFEQFGTVVDACVLPQRYPNNPDRAGLVRMSNPEEAQWCADKLDGTTPNGFTMPLTVRLKKGKGADGQETGGESWDVGQMELYAPHMLQLEAGNTPQMQDPPVHPQLYGDYGDQMLNPEAEDLQQQLQAQELAAQQLQAQQLQAQLQAGQMQAVPLVDPAPAPMPMPMPKPQPTGDPNGADRLWVKGLPLECTDEWLKQVFELVAPVQDCKVLPQKYPNNPDRSGLVRMCSAEAATWCIENMSGTTPQGFAMPITIRYAKRSSVADSQLAALAQSQQPQHPTQQLAQLAPHLAQALQNPQMARALLAHSMHMQPPHQQQQQLQNSPNAMAQQQIQSGAAVGATAVPGSKALVRGLPPHCDDTTLALFFSQFGEVQDTEVVSGGEMAVVTFESEEAMYAACVNGTQNVIDGKWVSVEPFDVTAGGAPAGARPDPATMQMAVLPDASATPGMAELPSVGSAGYHLGQAAALPSLAMASQPQSALGFSQAGSPGDGALLGGFGSPGDGALLGGFGSPGDGALLGGFGMPEAVSLPSLAMAPQPEWALGFSQAASANGEPKPVDLNGLWIRGLPLDYDEAALKAFFAQYGEVLDAKILPRKYPHNPDQAGLVRMATPDLAQVLVEQLNGQQIPGFPLPLRIRISTSTAPPNRGVKRPLGGM